MEHKDDSLERCLSRSHDQHLTLSKSTYVFPAIACKDCLQIPGTQCVASLK